MAIDLAAFHPQLIAAAVPELQVSHRRGSGGQKAVWECNYLGQRYVLKVLVAEPDSTERAKRELEVYWRCDSPYLPKVGPLPLSTLPIGEDVILYYLEEYVDGRTLAEIPHPMPTPDVIAMATCVNDAIEELWKKNFVHRDIKPANIVRKSKHSAIRTPRCRTCAGLCRSFADRYRWDRRDCRISLSGPATIEQARS